MRRLVRLAILPVAGLVLIGLALIWSGRELHLRLQGKPAVGEVIGMVLQRPGNTDVLRGMDTAIVLGLANGDRILAGYTNYRSQSLLLQNQQGESDVEQTSLPPTTARILNESLRGDAEILRWGLLRESRRPSDPKRIVRIEKTETVHGYFGLKEAPELFAVTDGRISLDGQAREGIVTVRAVFDRSNTAEVLANKGETLVEYSYIREGLAVEPEKKNFFLFAEPYSTQFRPVFGFGANDVSVARVSHIGRHGGPTLALRLYEPCEVYYDPANPSEAILIAIPGKADGDWLGWFSRFCEGTFGQWGSGSLIVLAGLLFGGTGLLFISLAIVPSKNLHL